MSAEHRLRAQLRNAQRNRDGLARKVKDQQKEFNNQKRALQSSIEKQRRFNNNLNSKLETQERNSQQAISRLETDFKTSKQKLNDQYIKQRNHFNQRLSNQQEQFSNELKNQEVNFKTSIDKESRERKQAIDKQTVKFQQLIDNEAITRETMIKGLRDYTDYQMGEMRDDFEQVAKAQQKEIDQIRATTEDHTRRIQMNEDMAQAMIDDLKTIIDDIYADNGLVRVSDYERFCPGELAQRTGRLQKAIDMFNRSSPQASIAHSQGVMDGLIDLESKVMQEKQKFDIEYALAILAYEYLTEAIRQNEMIPLKGNDDYRLDEWTDGQYQQLKTEIEKEAHRLENEYDNLTVKDLENFQKRRDAYFDRLQAVIDKGVDRVISSQQRRDMAIEIGNVLEEYNFEPIKAGYEQSDMKKAFMVGTIRHIDDTEITVTIIPDEEDYANHISINTDQPGFLKIEDADLRTDAIVQKLREKEIDVERSASLPEHNTELMDCYKLTDPNGRGIPKHVLEKVKGVQKNR